MKPSMRGQGHTFRKGGDKSGVQIQVCDIGKMEPYSPTLQLKPFSEVVMLFLLLLFICFGIKIKATELYFFDSLIVVALSLPLDL